MFYVEEYSSKLEFLSLSTENESFLKDLVC